MAIESALDPNMLSLPMQGESEEELSVEIVNPEAVSIETEDGGVLIDFGPEMAQDMPLDFDSNLADFIDQQELRTAWYENRRSVYTLARCVRGSAPSSCRSSCSIPSANDYGDLSE